MNHLLHFLLARDDEELRLGSLLGDMVKGRVERFAHPGVTPQLRTGIQLHRTIDSFSDQHPAVHRSKQRLAPRYGRLSGVLVDVFYDHVLARSWTAHHTAPLPAFTQDVYRTLQANLSRLPEAIHPLVGAMTRHDWLLSYASLDGIDRALRGMAHRMPIARGIAPAALDLEQHYDHFADDFATFFPELLAHTEAFLDAHADPRPDHADARRDLRPAT
jgi:acyl carrier protein phosphodiesterase